MSSSRAPGTLRESLEAYSANALAIMGKGYGLDTKTGKRPGIIDRLVAHLLDPEVLQKVIADLSPAERAALEYVLLEGGEVATERLRPMLEKEGLVGKAPPPRGGVMVLSSGNASPAFRALMESMAKRALLLAPAAYNKLLIENPSAQLFVPTDLRPLLAEPLFPRQTVAAPGQVVAALPENLLRDVYILVTSARAEPIPLISNGSISKRALLRLDEQMRQPEGAERVRSETELQRFPRVRALAESAGLLQRTINGLTAPENAASWMDLPAGERLQTLVRAYRTGAQFSDLERLADVRISPRKDLGAKELPGRTRVLDAIAALPTGVWIALNDLERQLRVAQYDFLMAYQSPYSGWSGFYHSPYSVYDRYSGYNSLELSFRQESSGPVDWAQVEGQFIREVVTHSLHLLGVVDIGGPPDAAPDLFRVTEIGAALLRGETPALDREPGRVVVQPNFQVLAFEPVPESVLYTLDQMADRVRIEQVAEYKITAESVGRGLSSGMESEFAVDFLTRLAGPLPQNVRRSIEEWGGRRNRIRVRRGVALMQAHDPTMLDHLLDDPALAPLLAERPGADMVVVRGDAVDALYDVLLTPTLSRPLVLPALSEGEDGNWENSVQIDDAGVVRPRMRRSSFYLTSLLTRIAEPSKDGTYRITRASIRSATRMGYDHERLLGLLQGISDQPIPASVTETVRQSSYRWGRAGLTQVLLLEAQTPEIMAEMRADPEIGPLIDPLEEATTIARVTPEHADRLRALLEDRGAEIPPL